MLSFEELYEAIKKQSQKQLLYKMLLDKIDSLSEQNLQKLKEKIEAEGFEESSDFMLAWEYGPYELPIIERKEN